MMLDVFLSVQQYIYLRMWSENVSIVFHFFHKDREKTTSVDGNVSRTEASLNRGRDFGSVF